MPVNVIKELAGHKWIETTLRYMHSDRVQKRDAIDALRGAVLDTGSMASS